MSRLSHSKIVSALLMGLITITLSVCTWKQTGHWRNDETLFNHVLQIDQNNWFAHNNLGVSYNRQEKRAQALIHFSRP